MQTPQLPESVLNRCDIFFFSQNYLRAICFNELYHARMRVNFYRNDYKQINNLRII